MKSILIAAGLMFGALLPMAHAAEVAPEFRADILKLITLTKADELAYQVMSNMIHDFQKKLPNVPEDFWKKFVDGKDQHVQAFKEITLSVYARHLSADDIKGLIAFYSSPLGQKLIDKLPVITQESMQLGQVWGQKFAERIIGELRKAGYLGA